MAKCIHCGQETYDGASFCPNCGAPLPHNEQSDFQNGSGNSSYSYGPGPGFEAGNRSYQAPGAGYQDPRAGYDPNAYNYAPQQKVGQKDKLVAGLLAILLGSLGIHKFYLGYTGTGVLMLLVSILTLGLGAVVMEIIGIIEGILYLSKSDYEFYQTYEVGQKKWF